MRRRVVVNAEAVAIALGGGKRGVETHADHVDDLGLFPDRHAGKTDVGQETADVNVDLVLFDHLQRLAARDVGLGLVVRDHQLDRPAIDADVLVDAVARHLQADNRGLAPKRCRAGQRLFRTDLIGLGAAESRAPRRRHQHRGADSATAPTHQTAARNLAAVPEVFRPFFVFPLFSHGPFLPYVPIRRSRSVDVVGLAVRCTTTDPETPCKQAA